MALLLENITMVDDLGHADSSRDYPEVSGEYGRRITPDIRSPKRSLNGFSDYAEIVHVAERLAARSYRDDDIHRILAGTICGSSITCGSSWSQPSSLTSFIVSRRYPRRS